MSLAVLKYKGQNDEYLQFEADTGTANFYSIVLGEEIKKIRVSNKQYIKVLTGNKIVSNLQELDDKKKAITSSFPLKIPVNAIPRETNYVQLYSFKRRNAAPTISNIIRLPIRFRNNQMSKIMEFNLLQPEVIKEPNTLEAINVKKKANSCKEPAVSKPMFLQSLVGALPSLLKSAVPLLGGLLGNLMPKGSNGGTNSDQVSEIITKLIEVLGANKSNAQSSVSNSLSGQIQVETLLQLQPILERILSPQAIEAIGDNPQKLFMAIKEAILNTEKDKLQSLQPNSNHKKFSTAKVAPALLALLPMLEKVIDPKMIEAIGNQPVKLFKAIGDAVLKMDKQELEHLEKINPGLDSSDDISKLLAGMSIAKSKDSKIQFNYLKNYSLNFESTQTVYLKGKNRVVYSKQKEIKIPYRIASNSNVNIDKVIDRSIIQISIKDAITTKIIFRKKIRVSNMLMSHIVHEAVLTKEETKKIPCNRELNFEVAHIWKASSGENIGVFKSHFVYFIDEYVYDKIGKKVGENHHLNDLTQHRKFWHKIWQGGFSESRRWEIDYNLKYYYILNTLEEGISKLETRQSIEYDSAKSDANINPKDRREIKGKLKSGFEFSLESINSLLMLLNQKPLDNNVLKVLKESDFYKELKQEARQQVSLRGRQGDTVSLWSYPEVALRKLHLSRVGSINMYGMVEQLTPIDVLIVKPEAIHFLGTKSE